MSQADHDRASKLAIELVECGDKIDALNEQLSKLNAEYETREKQLVELYDMNKIAAIKVMANDVPRSVSRGKKFYAKRKETATPKDVYDACKADGIPELCQETVNANSLTAYLKIHLNQEGASLPPHLAKVIDAKEFPHISVRKN